MFRSYSGQYAPALSKKLHPCSVTLACDNAVEMVNKRCPSDPFKCFLLIVARNLHRKTMLYFLRRDQKAFNSNKI